MLTLVRRRWEMLAWCRLIWWLIAPLVCRVWCCTVASCRGRFAMTRVRWTRPSCSLEWFVLLRLRSRGHRVFVIVRWTRCVRRRWGRLLVRLGRTWLGRVTLYLAWCYTGSKKVRYWGWNALVVLTLCTWCHLRSSLGVVVLRIRRWRWEGTLRLLWGRRIGRVFVRLFSDG